MSTLFCSRLSTRRSRAISAPMRIQSVFENKRGSLYSSCLNIAAPASLPESCQSGTCSTWVLFLENWHSDASRDGMFTRLQPDPNSGADGHLSSRTLEAPQAIACYDRFQDPSSSFLSHQSGRASHLTEGFCDLILAIFMQDNCTLHETLGNELAWYCIHLILEQRRFAGLIEAVAKWPHDTRQQFLHELAASIFQSWCVPLTVDLIHLVKHRMQGLPA